MTEYHHMRWCIGDHNTDGDCLIAREFKSSVDDVVTVELTGIPCDFTRIDIEPAELFNGSDIQQLTEILAELAPLLDAGIADAHCEDHDHSDDDLSWLGDVDYDEDEDEEG